MSINTEVTREKGVVIFKVKEPEINHKNAAFLKEKIFLEIAEGKSKIILDLEDVKEMDSSGLGALLFGKRQAGHAKGDIILVGVQPAVHSMLRIAQLARIFDIYESKQEALSALSS
jgi:anti-sigma B factor antagonist